MPPWYDFADQITKITVNEGITRVGSLSFYGCTNLNFVTLPAGLVSIGTRAFKDCSSLSFIAFPAELTMIGEAAFENCAKLSGIRLPNGLKTIGDYAFYRCSGLTTITIPASVQSFGSVVFAYCKNLTQATFKCALKRLPDWTFYECNNLVAVVLPETIETTGEYAFHDCTLLENIHYTGVEEEQLLEDIRKDDNSISPSGGITSQEHDGKGSSLDFSFDETGSVGTSESITVRDTENALITKEVTTESTYQIDGKDVTIDEIAESEGEVDIEVNSKSNVVINATVDNSEGWTELAEDVDYTLENLDQETSDVKVNVNVPENKVSGDDLAKLAGKDVTVNVVTPANDIWQLNGKAISETRVAEKTYDFGFEVIEEKAGKLDCEAVYRIKFAEDANFTVMVGVRVGHPLQLATLYQKNGRNYEELQTIIIDTDGIAWLTFAEIQKKGEYYVGINVEGKKHDDASIPSTLYEEYGLSEETVATLTDSHGNLYKVGERTSAWGITGSEFALYIAIVLVGIVLVVTLLMVTLNKIKKSKEKIRAEKSEEDDDDYDDDEPIDEEALRLEIMQELLDEMKKE